MPAKKRNTAQVEVTYLVEIESWDWGYSFSSHGDRHSGDPYTEFRQLEITGSLLQPKGIKADGVKLFLLPDKQYNQENRQDLPSLSVGSLQLNDGTLHVVLSMPDDVLAPIISALGVDALRYATIRGSKLRYRKGLVHDYGLDRTYEEDDF
jgi:hypothetical protein